MSGLGAALLFAAMLALMALRMPIWAAMFLPGVAGYAIAAGPDALLAHLKGATFARFTVYELSVIPLFVLMGQLATRGGLSALLFQCAAAFVGHLRGGLAMASILACAGFGAICGSSVATAATVSAVALPQMRRFGYHKAFSTATLAAGGTLGVLVPPSVVLVIYAVITEQNIAKLFAGAVVPGLLAALGYLSAIAVFMRLRPDAGPAQARVDWRTRLRLLVSIWPVLLIFVAVFGGIYGGVFTATEGASVGTLGVLLLGLARRRLGATELRAAVLAAAQSAGMIFMIFVGADLLNAALALTQVPARLAAAVGEMGLPPLWILAGILLFYIVLAGVMDELSMLLLTLPVVFPTVMQLDLYGLDPVGKAVWFGVLVLCVVNIGLIAPPVGLNVYVISHAARDVPMAQTYRYVFVFLAADALRLGLLLAFPALSLWLVQFVR